MKPVLIIGTGGHAKVVADALLASGRQVLGFTSGEAWDGEPPEVLPGLKVLGTDEVLCGYAAAYVDLVNGLGGIDCSGLRRHVQERFEAEGWHFSGVRHPEALVSPFAVVSAGVHLLAACVVQAGARIGTGSIVNTAAVVEHDSVLGDYVHVAPRAIVCGATHVGSNSHVGAGAILLQGLQVGPNTLVGAGAIVVKHFGGRGTLVGVPARHRE
jgi:sugar O-acyltransferase (sialic acid O-acetyltransferase NeuD family)